MISWRLIQAVARRPDLWAESVRSLFAVAPRQWWRHAPFIPAPEAAYASWRLLTAHGDLESGILAEELISYLEWRRRQHRVLGRV